MKKSQLGRIIAAAAWIGVPMLLQAESKTILSPVYTIDKIYRSMEGPTSTQSVALLPDEAPQLVWITDFRTTMVAGDGSTETLPEFMCHVNLDYGNQHTQNAGWHSLENSRIATLSQGQIDVHFPKGFGLPLPSNEPLSMTTQVLNLNLDKANFQVRHKVTFEFTRDKDLSAPMKPLFNTSVFGMKLLQGKDGHFGMAMDDAAHHGASCLPGSTAPNAIGGSSYADNYGRSFTGHWVVKPGREVNHTNVTKYLNLPYDTTLHYIAVHLHPYAESLTLRDLTTGKTIFKSKTRGYKDKIGLSFVDSFSSEAGIPLYKNHEYDLISVYNNTTKSDKDSMAVMLLFLLDKQFQKPNLSTPPVTFIPPAPGAAPRAVFHTSLGKLTVELYPGIAPKTVAQFSQLVEAGVYDGVSIYRVIPGFLVQTTNASDRAAPLTDEQKALLDKLPLEPSTLAHTQGVLSMAHDPSDPNGGESSFLILLGPAPQLDGGYTAFGKVVGSEKVLEKIEAASTNADHLPVPAILITKAEMLTSKK